MAAMSLDETTFNTALTGTGASCTSTATGCSVPSTRPRTRCRTRSCAAWKARASFAGGEGLRAWLYKIATNVCLDSLRAKKRRPAGGRVAEIPWLQPYPDRLLDEVAPTEEEPDAVVVARETIELTYIAVIQLLPARQRAVLSARRVVVGGRDGGDPRPERRRRPTARCSAPGRR